jgi:glycosyltransferase involved in cell wall biosynthesis
VANLYSLALAGLAVLKDVPIFQGARPSKMFPIMASGVPVLYSGAGEGALLVQKKAQAGIVTSPESSQALAEGVMHLADNPGLARELGKNGRKYVEEYFNWQTLVADWLRELEGEEVEEYYG